MKSYSAMSFDGPRSTSHPLGMSTEATGAPVPPPVAKNDIKAEYSGRTGGLKLKPNRASTTRPKDWPLIKTKHQYSQVHPIYMRMVALNTKFKQP